jgi:GNAT superfamily N-acetyltransferase
MVIVDLQYRGQGIGTALLERAVCSLDSRSVLCMKLDATPQGKPVFNHSNYAIPVNTVLAHESKLLVNETTKQSTAGTGITSASLLMESFTI